MFLRRKVMGNAAYYDVAESYREDRQVKKRVLVSLGRCSSVEEAVRSTEFLLKRLLSLSGPISPKTRKRVSRLQKKLEILGSVVSKSWTLQTVNSGYIPQEEREAVLTGGVRV